VPGPSSHFPSGKSSCLPECAQVCIQCASCLHYSPCAYLAHTTEKCAKCTLVSESALCLHFICTCLYQVCIKSAFSPTVSCSQENLRLICRLGADNAHTLHTLCRLGADFVVKSVHLAHSAHLAKVIWNHALYDIIYDIISS
jgi:hypothetical protein